MTLEVLPDQQDGYTAGPMEYCRSSCITYSGADRWITHNAHPSTYINKNCTNPKFPGSLAKLCLFLFLSQIAIVILGYPMVPGDACNNLHPPSVPCPVRHWTGSATTHASLESQTPYNSLCSLYFVPKSIKMDIPLPSMLEDHG